MEAIRSATYWPAVLMGVESDVGTFTPGKYADIIAVRGDVLRYINLLQGWISSSNMASATSSLAQSLRGSALEWWQRASRKCWPRVFDPIREEYSGRAKRH